VGGGLIRSLGGWSQVVAVRRRKDPVKGDERILGTTDFVLGVLREVKVQQRRQLRWAKSESSIERILKEECHRGQVTAVELESGVRRQEEGGTAGTE
jgi:putative transposase